MSAEESGAGLAWLQRIKTALALVGIKGADGNAIASPANPLPTAVVRQNVSTPDTGNSKFYTSADGVTPFVGTAYDTRNPVDTTKRIVAAQQVVFASNVASGLGATFTFEYGPDGSSWPISETRVIVDFATVRDLTLQNAGNFMRMSFTPSRALTGAEFINLDTSQWFIEPPAFVRLATQEIEEQNAALTSTFSYSKSFDPFTRKSVNLRPQAVHYVPTPAVTPLAGAAVYLSDAIDTLGFSSIRLLICTNQISAASGVVFEWSDTSTFTVTRTTDPDSYTLADATFGSSTYDAVTKARYLRLRYTNGATLQGSIFLEFQFNSAPFLEETTLKTNSGPRTSQNTVTASAAEIVTPLTGRRGLTLKCISTSSRSLFYGFTSGVTTSTGMELAAGDFIDREYDDSVRIWVIQAGGSGTVTACVEECL